MKVVGSHGRKGWLPRVKGSVLDGLGNN